MKKTLSKYEIGMDEVNESIDALREQILKEEREKHKVLFEKNLEEINKKSLSKLSNNVTSKDEYRPYLIPFENLLERIKGKNELDSSDEAIKIRMDLAEQLSKMKKYPPLNTICHIESTKNYSEFRHVVSRVIFKRKKYKIIFHDKKVKFEDKYYVKEMSLAEFLFISVTLILFCFLFFANLFCSFKLTFKVIITFFAFIFMLYRWA